MVNDALKGRRHLICIIIGVSLRSGLVIDCRAGVAAALSAGRPASGLVSLSSGISDYYQVIF